MPPPISHLIQCNRCGAEFRSAFSGAVSAIGCQETCPSCGGTVDTPFLAGHDNFAALEKRYQEPMVRTYGDDGYVFMGKGTAFSQIRSDAIAPISNAYDRNLHRALDLLELVDTTNVAQTQLLLGVVMMATMTAYECLIDDLLEALRSLRALKEDRLRKGSFLARRRDAVLESLGCPISDGHVSALRYLYEIRNCLTHKAGIVDEEFINRIQRLGDVPELTAAGPGTPLILYRRDATSFLDSLQHLASALLKRAEALTGRL